MPSSTMSYDPDDFDNNPFGEPHEPVVQAPLQFPSPYDNNIISASSPIDKQNQELPRLPQEAEEEGNERETADKKQTEPDLTLLPERRSKKNYSLTIRVTGIERVGKKDPIFKFDVQTTLPNFRVAQFKDIRRSYGELEKFFEYLNGANPECFVPSLPGPQTSYGAGSQEDEATLQVRLQRWFDRVTLNPLLIRNQEFVYFIENDSGYSPVSKGKIPASGLKRKTLKQFQPPYDEVTELVEFRPYTKAVYVHTQAMARSFERLTRLRKGYGLHMSELGNRVAELASFESSHPGMANLWQKFGKALIVYGDIEAVKSVYEAALLGDEVSQISEDAYVIKEQLTNRHLLMRELLNAEQTTKSKHGQALKVKTKRYEDPVKIDTIIRELEESKAVEDGLRAKISRISSNMLIEKSQVSQARHRRLKEILRDYTSKIIETERRTLSNFEKIRIDVRLVDENGGLSRLGRESYPKVTATLRNSQRYDGDDWSGDRKHRRSNSGTGGPEGLKEAFDAKDFVDAKSAASLLGTSTF